MCGLSTVVTPAGASLTMYREIRSYANSIWDDNNNCHTLKPGCKGGVCLVGEKPVKELPGIVGARGDTV